MSRQAPVRVSGRTRDLVILADRGIYWFTHHWVAFLNLLLLLLIVPMFLAPYLMSSGRQALGRLLYTIYGPTCHQLPERSFFLFGEKLAYTWEELVRAGLDPATLPYERRDFLGTPELGYKLLVCQRDTATYLGLFVLGALYGLFARRWLRPLPIWGLLLFLAPLALDGMTQAAGLRESTPLLRTLTGLCVAAGSIWFAYPHIEAAMAGLRRDVARKLGREA